MSKQTPRGIRNHNPLNIVIGNDWKGELPNTDGCFEQFESDFYGYRAALILIRKYIEKYNLKTISQIISRWCPDEHTTAYANIVSRETRIPLHHEFSFSDKYSICLLVHAMTYVENGEHLDFFDIQKAYDAVINNQ